MADEEISSKKEEPVKGEAVDGATPTAKESEGWVLHPYSEFRKWWLMLMVIVTFINVIMIPVSVSFFTLEITRSLTWIAVNVVMDVLFVLDIALNFRVGYETDDTQYVIMDLPLIRMHYIKTWFFVDLLAILPLDYCLLILDVAIGLDLSVSGISGLRMMRLIKLIRMLSLLRLLRLPRFMRYIREWEQMAGWDMGRISTTLKLTHIIVTLILACHWNACIQFMAAMLMDFPDNCWVVLDGLLDKPIWYQYSKSMLRAFSQMMALNNGSKRVPKGVVELWVAIISIAVGVVLHALTLAKILQLYTRKKDGASEFETKKKNLMEFLEHHNIPFELRVKVAKHLKKRYNGQLFDEDAILATLSEPLRREVIHSNHTNLVSSAPMFKDMNPSFLDELLDVLVFEMFDTDDHIMSKGELVKGMYFIDRGAVKVETDDVIQVLTDESFFGELCLEMSGGKTNIAAKALSTCRLYSLSSEDYRRVLERFHIPKERKEEGSTHQELPKSVLSDILTEVVLQEGDKAYSTLALVCSTFRNIVSTDRFRRQAHFLWLNSVTTWCRVSANYRAEFYTMYRIGTCMACGRLYKVCTGYIDTGKRGKLEGIYSDSYDGGYCDNICRPRS